jgi:hypothetical protein
MNLCLVIVAVALCQLFHRLEIGEHTRAMIDLVVVGIHRAQRVEIVALPLRPGVDGLGFFECGCAFCEILGRGCDVRIVQQAQRDTPIGDGAFRIGFQRVFERLLRSAVPERVLIEHGLIEVPRSFCVAGGLEMDLAEFG